MAGIESDSRSDETENMTPVQYEVVRAIVTASEALDKISHTLQNIVDVQSKQEERLRQIASLLLELNRRMTLTTQSGGFLDTLALAILQRIGGGK